MSGQYFRSAYLEDPKVVRPRFLADGGGSAVTMPNPGADAEFVLTAGDQTIAGAKAFSGGLSAEPATGFGTGAGGVLFEADVLSLNADAPPFRITAHAYTQDSGAEPDNVAWRWGTAQPLTGIAGLADGFESNFAMVVESSFFTGGIHQGEAYWEVYGGDGAAGETSVRPIFCTWDNADVANTIGFSVLAGGFAVAEPAAANSFFTMNRRFSQYGVSLESLTDFFAVQGNTAFGAEPTKGQLRFYGYADSTKKMKIGWHGGGGAAFAIAGEAPGGSPDQNPTIFYLSVGGGFSSYLALRRRTDTDSETAFGFGITPAASADNNSVHFADNSSLVFQTTTGTKIGTSATQKMGFWGATPIVRPTIATADAASIITALANIGLVVDGTA